MSKRILVSNDQSQATTRVADYLLEWCLAHPGQPLGGATGNSPIPVWKQFWKTLEDRPGDRVRAIERDAVFLDEYFGAYPAYYHWAWRNLRVGEGGFAAERVFVPRGCFFEDNRIVNSTRLEQILKTHQDEYEAYTEPGEDNTSPPEVRIKETARHPLLVEIRQSLLEYEAVARAYQQRLQLLGIGVGGAIASDPLAGGHIGFVEYGAASKESKTMLVRLAKSTQAANQSDFALKDVKDRDMSLEPSVFALTQGISTILAAKELLVMAWGETKARPVERMFLGAPNPKNPAAWVQTHNNVTVFLDRAAFGTLDRQALQERGWTTE